MLQYRQEHKRTTNKDRPIPGEPFVLQATPLPSPHWLWGNLKPFMADILRFLRDADTVGPFTRFRLFKTQVYLVSEPGLVDTVLTNKSHAFVRNRSFAKRLRRLFGHGLLTSEGDEWKQLRKLTAPAFQPKSTNTYIPIILEEADRLMLAWQAQPQVAIDREMSTITARIITRCAFGMELQVDLGEMQASMDALMNSLAPRLRFPINTPDWLPVGGNRAYRRAVKRVDRFIHQALAQRVHQTDTPNTSLLADLARAAEQAGSIRPAHLRDQVVTLFLAGHETTASTLTFALILLSQHPQYWQAVQAEAAATALDGLSNLQQVKSALPATHNVIRETMRLYPAGYIFGRTVVKPPQLGQQHPGTACPGHFLIL